MCNWNHQLRLGEKNKLFEEIVAKIFFKFNEPDKPTDARISTDSKQKKDK